METIRSEFAGCPIVIGGGLAGLMTALRLAPQHVILLAKTPLAEGAASGLGAGRRRRRRRARTTSRRCTPPITLAAGDGLSDPAVVRRIAASAPAAIAELERLRRRLRPRRRRRPRARPGGRARPPPHRPCRRRRHGCGDHARAGRRGAGHALDHRASRAGGAPPAGRRSRHRGRAGGRAVECLLCCRRRRVVLATGGLGGLYAHTTNPLGAIGQGVALAARAGAALSRHGVRAVPSHRARRRARSHAAGQAKRVRGEGAVLVD